MNTFLNDKTILLIARDKSIKKKLKLAFSGIVYKLKRVDSGRKALTIISAYRPDIILAEYQTKDIDGKEFLDLLMKDHDLVQYQHIPIVFLSDPETRQKNIEELFERGINGWFSLPFDHEEIRELLENIFLAHDVFQKNRELRQEVKRSEYRYRDILENANDFIFTLDDKGHFVYLNNRFTPLTAYDKEEWLNKNFIDLINPQYREIASTYYQLAHQGKARIFEAGIISNGNRSPVLSFNITPIIEKGNITGSMGIARDVTEQKEMEREIIDLKNFNESIIQSMDAGLLTLDLKGQLTSLNDGGKKILELKTNEIIGKELGSILQPEEVNFLLSKPATPGSLPYSREMELTIKPGKKISIGFTVTDRLDIQNRKVGTIISFRDISLLKQMQSEVIRMDRLASLGVLASGIAHEIKNPLAGIKTLAQTCIEEFDTSDSRVEYLTRIVRQVNRLDELLKTIQAYARPKPPDRRNHKISDILQEVFNLVSKKLTSHKIEYIEELNPHIPEIMVDGQQIQQVFLNLILNSVEAMSDGGVLKITACEKKSDDLSLKPIANNKTITDRSMIEVRFSDTGSGIASDQLQTIFDPFFTTKPNGLGLGLSIVHRIISEHSGEIHIDSRVDSGTTVTIMLPEGVPG